MWINLIKYTKLFYGINKDLVSWRSSKNSLSGSNFQKLKDAFLLYKKHLDFSFLFSIFCVIRLTFYAFKKKLKYIYKKMQNLTLVIPAKFESTTLPHVLKEIDNLKT